MTQDEKQLRSAVIRLANAKPSLRADLLPLVKEAGGDFDKQFPEKKITKKDVEKDPDRVEKEAKKSISNFMRLTKGDSAMKAVAKKFKDTLADARHEMTNNDPQFGAKMITKLYKDIRSKANSFDGGKKASAHAAGDLSKLPPALREQAEKKQEEAKKNKGKDKDDKDDDAKGKDKKAAASWTLVATNEAIYQWEYTYIKRTATVSASSSGSLHLTIEEFSEKSGMNPHTHTRTVENAAVGTLKKPDSRTIAYSLKNNNFQRTAASRPFTRQWADAQGNDAPLGAIIKAYRSSNIAGGSDSQKRVLIVEKVQNLSGADLDRLLKLL